jgi:hypothetical protein
MNVDELHRLEAYVDALGASPPGGGSKGGDLDAWFDRALQRPAFEL